MYITDGNKTVEIKMMTWNESTVSYDEDQAHEFFEAGVLEMNEDGAYIVDDVDYCIDQAEDWENQQDENTVFVYEV